MCPYPLDNVTNPSLPAHISMRTSDQRSRLLVLAAALAPRYRRTLFVGASMLGTTGLEGDHVPSTKRIGFVGVGEQEWDNLRPALGLLPKARLVAFGHKSRSR